MLWSVILREVLLALPGVVKAIVEYTLAKPPHNQPPKRVRYKKRLRFPWRKY